MAVKNSDNKNSTNKILNPMTKGQSGVKPVLTNHAAAGKKPAPKKNRTRHTSTKRRHDVQVASVDDAVMSQDAPTALPGGAQTPSSQGGPAKIYLRSYTFEDEPVISKLTQDEISPVFKESYGYDLELMTVMNYVRSSQTRMILVEDEVAGYISYVLDDSGKMNIGALVLASAHQGKGYGTRIMKQIEQEARSYGAVELEVFIQEKNIRSQAFAKSLGFVEGPQVQPQTIVMVKPLQPGIAQPVN